MDSQIIAVLGGEDVELTFTQVQGQSTEVTDRAYTVTLTTGGGQGIRVLKSQYNYRAVTFSSISKVCIAY